MTPDETAFLRAIREAPDDNTARLVYADWLDDHGTTDQQKARAEWIRLTCWDTRKETSKPTDQRTRLPGERAWLKANLSRLWPHLYGSKAKWWPGAVNPSLLLGRVVVTVPLAIPEGPGKERMDYSRVALRAARGVTMSVEITFLRAAILAPVVAADEPMADIVFSSIPERCYSFGHGEMYVHSRPFAIRGLRDVWRDIEGGYGLCDDHEEVKTFPTQGSPFDVIAANAAIYASLTRWARRRAANPLVMGAA